MTLWPCSDVVTKRSQKGITGLFSVLRVIPSLAILLLMVPLLGTGTAPAVVALVLLAVPPILMYTAAGLETVPPFMLETADGLGMTGAQVRFFRSHPRLPRSSAWEWVPELKQY